MTTIRVKIVGDKGQILDCSISRFFRAMSFGFFLFFLSTHFQCPFLLQDGCSFCPSIPTSSNLSYSVPAIGPSLPPSIPRKCVRVQSSYVIVLLALSSSLFCDERCAAHFGLLPLFVSSHAVVYHAQTTCGATTIARGGGGEAERGPHSPSGKGGGGGLFRCCWLG